MHFSNFSEAINNILLKDSRYRSEAYFFLREALDFSFKRSKKSRKEKTSVHISAAELLEGFRFCALKEFGPMAITVFKFWGINNAADIGHMIFNLIDVGILAKTENDQLSSFAEGLDFQQAFVFPFLPKTALPSEPLATKVSV